MKPVGGTPTKNRPNQDASGCKPWEERQAKGEKAPMSRLRAGPSGSGRGGDVCNGGLLDKLQKNRMGATAPNSGGELPGLGRNLAGLLASPGFSVTLVFAKVVVAKGPVAPQVLRRIPKHKERDELSIGRGGEKTRRDLACERNTHAWAKPKRIVVA